MGLAQDIPQDTDLAIAYFKIASEKKNPDATYKLGDIYGNDKWGLKDKELSIYYYSLAVQYIVGLDWRSASNLLYEEELQAYPSLCFALSRELGKDGGLFTNTSLSYQFLILAKIGYQNELANGFGMYQKAYDGVVKLMADPQYDEVRDYLDNEGLIIEEYGDKKNF